MDETRSLDDFSGFASIKKGVLEYLPSIKIDPWRGQTILVLTESRSMKGTLEEIASRYRVRIASSGGQCAGFLHTTIAPVLKKAFKNGRLPPLVLTIGDYDLAGGHIDANNRRVLEEEVGERFEEENWERVALTETQVENLRETMGEDMPKVIKTDNRFKPPLVYEALECETLGQKPIMDLLEAKLDALLPAPLERVHEREERQRRALRKKIR